MEVYIMLMVLMVVVVAKSAAALHASGNIFPASKLLLEKWMAKVPHNFVYQLSGKSRYWSTGDFPILRAK